MAACLPTLRSRVRPDTVKCLHRDFGSLAANRSNHANNVNNGEKRDKLAHRVGSFCSYLPVVPYLTAAGLLLRPSEREFDPQRRQTIPGSLQAHPRQQT